MTTKETGVTEFWLFLHLAAAVIWVGGGTALLLLQSRLEKAQAGPALGAVGQQMGFLSRAVFMPASILAVITGVALVLSVASYDFEDAWIALGLAGFLFTFATGMAVLTPASKRLAALVADKGPQDPEVGRLRTRMKRVSLLNVVVLWLVVLDMAVKPGA